MAKKGTYKAKTQSSPEVIAQGKSKLEELQKYLYLHTYKGNYGAIAKSDFTPESIDFMNAIWDKVITRQRAREQQFYQIAGISGVKQLNDLFKEAGGQHDFLDVTIKDIISEAIQKIDISGKATKTKEKAFNEAVQEAMKKIVGEQLAADTIMQEALGSHLTSTFATILANAPGKAKEKKIKQMSDYADYIGKALSAQFRGETLEATIAVAADRLLKQLGTKGKVQYTGKLRNAKGKQIKADNLMTVFNTDATVDLRQMHVGISAKHYTVDADGSADISLHSPNKLQNFYKMVETMNFEGGNSSEKAALLKVIQRFRSPDFIYHVINQAAHFGAKNFATTDVGDNIVQFIKKCLPLFIGAQFKIWGDQYNVDFFNINGQFVPVSTVLEDIRDGRGFAEPRVGLYNNFDTPWVQMRNEKLAADRDGVDNQFYITDVLKVGRTYGTQLYDKIKIGTIHLKLALAKL